ncbi:BgTH12-04987 [Blumeria graminis f. sp. triticale]|uniref:BgtE-3466 n=3 Tax=Blumeria graminis TaxID=34373 RepID=A0A061HP15_BLUGR|nr:putative secreted effector protein [Blumeria graminis f. sp. tritici 96224]CAD6502395.1 BgTH12-04987 [Blumeria graminis f. sp. triticale]VDB87665.1 BgtE-3466 [Blumeria graminis f. sp. tritici]
MLKIFRFAVGLFFSEYLQRNFCYASGAYLRIGQPEKTLNDFVCRDQYFTGGTVKASIEHACKFMHTTNRQAIFPALLEEYVALGRDSGALLTWPLIHENKVYISGTKGRFRAVFNLECDLVGVIIRHESHFQPCFELLHDDNERIDEEIGLDSQEYEGFKCPLATFSFSYVYDSMNKALLSPDRYFPKPYVIGTSLKQGGDIPLIWPLFGDHILSPHGKNSDNRQRYYVVFTRKEGMRKVIHVYRGVETKCERIRKTIVPYNSRLNIPESPESMIGLDDLGRDCSGQIFTGRYIEMNRKKAMIAIADKISGKNMRINIPRATKRKGVPLKSWIWPIRGWETSRKDPTRIRSYALVFEPNLQFLDVYTLGMSGLTKCNKIYDPKRTAKKIKETGIDLNIPASCIDNEGLGRDC